jgi:malic enzyme
MDYNQASLDLCREKRGKLEVISKAPVTNRDELSTAYTPGVAEPCRKIHTDKHDVYKYTIKSHTLVFPGLFRGALMVEARQIVEEMKLAAAKAIASLCSDDELNEEYIIPGAFDKRVALVVAEQVAKVAEQLGIARNPGNREF